MSSFWSSTTQKIYEVICGVRTKDTEFDIKVEEIKSAEMSLRGIKSIFSNFNNNTYGIKKMCKDVYTNLTQPYTEASPYWNFVTDIAQSHQEIERLYDVLNETIGLLSKQTLEWDKHFTEAKNNVTQREDFRRKYDHYDEKLEKIVKNRNDKTFKGISETQKEIDLFDRVTFLLIYLRTI